MGKHKNDKVPPLSDYWMPPADTGLKDGVGEPVACLATTFEFNADFFEAELLPRFLGLHFDNTENERTFIIEREEALAKIQGASVLVDISKFDPRQTTLQWDQVPIQVPVGVQHAKVTVLVWERLVRLIITSANLNRDGYRRNRELFATLDFFDGASSVPLKPLYDALVFIETMCAWSRALPAATQRARERVKRIRERVGRWSNARQDFSPKERPRVNLIAGHPKSQTGPAQSVVDQLLQLWGQRRANSLTVMTPFAGQNEGDSDKLLDRINGLPMTRNREGWLIVPEDSVTEGNKRCVVKLPQHFGHGWKKRFKQYACVLPVPKEVKGKDDRPRTLHAKSVLIQSESHDLLMIGSSNFTPHGMGVGVFNCEANLAFEDWANTKQEGVSLEGRLGLPVPWESVDVEDIDWQQPETIPEDAFSGKPLLPAFFAWASYSQMKGDIIIGLDRSKQEPPVWTINLVGQSSEQAPALFSRAMSHAEALTLSFTLDEKARGAHLAALRVSWQGEDESHNEGFIAMSVNDRYDLLPPEEFRNLTADTIIECLLSGREPAEWVDRQNAKRKRTPIANAALDSLRAVDTSNYLLYRVRSLGRALAAMADRIGKTAPTTDALRYRLLRDPLGPIYLANALCSDGNGPDGESSQVETSYRIYALAEMMLSLGYVGLQIKNSVGRDAKMISPLFLEARRRLRSTVQQTKGKSVTLPDDLNKYLNTAFAENARLLGISEEE